MIVADTSAFVAVIAREADEDIFSNALRQARVLYVSALTLFEIRIVIGARGVHFLEEFEALAHAYRPTVVPFDATAAQVAHDAYRRWGKGSGTGAKLNMGDCAAYALATSLDVPLLYKGDDFARTDVRSALA